MPKRPAFLAILLVLAAFGCSKDEPPSEPPPPPGPEATAPPQAPLPPEERELVVFAAASLREAFTTLGADFERAHAGVTLTFNFAGTQELRTQLEQGAPADVFASADQRHMVELVAAGRVVAPATFARNEPVVVVARERIDKILRFEHLRRAERIVIGTPEVPIGRYTQQILERAADLGRGFRDEVEANVVSRELNVKQVLAKVALGEADAAIVYRTDARAHPEIGVLPIPAELNVIAEYPIAAIAGAPHPKLARAFIELVTSPSGGAALRAAGFLAPEARAP